MPIRLSYINARGEEAILDDDEGTFAHELTGREGFEFPGLKLTEHEYGDGSTDVVAITVKDRSVTCFFWADPPDIFQWEEKFDEVKAILMQTGQKETSWGKLKIRMKDKHYVYLNCVYEKGLDSLVRDIGTRVKFSLTFKATDPYFYNGFDYSYTIKQDDRTGYLFFDNAIIVNTQAEARDITGEQNPGNNWWEVRINGVTKYYAIVNNSSIFMDTAVIYNTVEEAIEATGEQEPGNHWWPVTCDDWIVFDTLKAAKLYTGVDTEGTAWWRIKDGNAIKYKAVKTVTRYYAIIQLSSLYMSSSQSNTGQDLYIQCEKVYPDIIINGPAENISIENETTGRRIEIDPSIKLDVNEQINICTTPLRRKITYTPKVGKAVNLIPWLSADSTLDWWLAHGNNQVTFNNSATTPESYLKFVYTERRASVQ